MIVNRGQTKTITLKNGTVDGVLFNIYLLAAAVNTDITPADFNPAEIMCKTEFKYGKDVITVTQDNLQVLGLFSAKNYGIPDWYQGNVMTPKGVATKEDMIVSLFVRFGGPINVGDGDTLTMQVTAGRGVFGAALDQSLSYVEFNENVAVGVMRGIPQIQAQVVQADISNEKYSFGDNVARLMFLNFDQDTIQNQVITSLQISSDKLQCALNFFDLFNIDHNVYTSPKVEYRYGAAGASVPYLPKYPQTFCLYAWHGGKFDVLNNVNVNASYNTNNVNASQNYVVAQKFIITPEIQKVAGAKIAKHLEENHDVQAQA